MAIGTTAAILGAGAIAGGASIAAGAMQGKAAKSAAKAQAASADAAVAEQQRQYDLTREDTAPFRNVGVNALFALAQELGLDTGAPMSGGSALPASASGGAMTGGGFAPNPMFDPASAEGGGFINAGNPNDYMYWQGLPPGERGAEPPLDARSARILGYTPEMQRKHLEERGRVAGYNFSPSSGSAPAAASTGSASTARNNTGLDGFAKSVAGTQAADLVREYQGRGGDQSLEGLRAFVASAGDGLSSKADLLKSIDAYAALPPPRAPGLEGINRAQLERDFGAIEGDFASMEPEFAAIRRGEGFTESPDYEFRRKEGLRGVERSAAARGMLGSGRTLKALTEYSSGLASGEYGDWFNRQYGAATDKYSRVGDRYGRLVGKFGRYGDAFNRLAGVAGIGQSSTNQLASVGAQTSANTSNALLASGTARANGIIGQGNAAAAGLAGVGSSVNSGLGNYMFLNAFANRPAAPTTSSFPTPQYVTGGGMNWGS
jgi:hypothetical protein